MPGLLKKAIRLWSFQLSKKSGRNNAVSLLLSGTGRFGFDFERPLLCQFLPSSSSSPTIHTFPQPPFRHSQGGHLVLDHNSSLIDSKTDLNRFLLEIGTDPKEARYWLKHFSSSADGVDAFAVVCVEQAVMDSQALLELFASAISFLYRNSMTPVIVYGCDNMDGKSFQEMKNACVWNALKLSDMLESHGTFTRLLYPGCGVLQADMETEGLSALSPLITIQSKFVHQSLATGRLPILLSFGETVGGQMLTLNTWDVTAQVAKCLQPLKVLLVNSHGGFLDSYGKVIANINLPTDLSTCAKKPWFSPKELEIMTRVNKLLKDIPSDSSVVISSADTLLKELFTHRGSGTFFRATEAIHKHDSLDEIDLDKLTNLLNRSFEQILSETYLEEISSDIHAIYLSETYSGVAILLKGKQSDIPYMCKYAVTNKAQGQGTGEMLWDVVRQSEKSLFWRSKTYNTVNTWYFKKCEGCWNDHVWSVFWYGINDPSLSTGIIKDAVERPHSFPQETVA